MMEWREAPANRPIIVANAIAADRRSAARIDCSGGRILFLQPIYSEASRRCTREPR